MILNAMATNEKTDENVNLFNYDNENDCCFIVQHSYACADFSCEHACSENDCCFIVQHTLVLISAVNMPVGRMIVALLYNIHLC